MKKTFFLLLSAMLVACAPQNPPVTPGTNNGGQSGGTNAQTPEFSVKVSGALTVQVTNQNINGQFRYDWGDGTSETGYCPSHRYTGKGVYKITATYNSKSSSKTITVEEPTKCYIAGLRYEKIGKENKYYYVKIIDDDFFTTTWVQTEYKLLSSAILPYEMKPRNPIHMNGLSDDQYYYVQVFWDDKATGNGTQILKQKIMTSDILKYPTSITKESDNKDTKITILFSWE